MIGFGPFGILFFEGSASIFIENKILEEHLEFILIKFFHIINCGVIRMIIMKELLCLSVLNGVFEFEKSNVLLDLLAIVLSHELIRNIEYSKVSLFLYFN